jgi:ankyrin repeat protein
MAAFGGDNKGVVRLLDSGVDVNTRDSAGNTALIFAANQGNVELVSILLFRGADPNIKSNGGSAPLQVAKDNVTAGSEYVTVINLLKQYGAEE